MSLAAVTEASEFTYCWCGCGEVTNARHLRARDLRGRGLTLKHVAAEMGVSTDFVKKLLNGKYPVPVSLLGHRRPPNPSVVRQCLVCRESFKACGTKDCCDDRDCNSAQWRAGLQSTARKQAECDAYYRRHTPLLQPAQAVEVARSERVMVARGLLAQARTEQAEKAAAVRTTRERRREERRVKRAFGRSRRLVGFSLDAGGEFSDGGSKDLHGIVSAGDAFADPTFDAVCERLDEEQWLVKKDLAQINSRPIDDRIVHVEGPCGKVRYRSRRDAERKLRFLARRFRADERRLGRIEHHVYRCPECGFFHLTSKTDPTKAHIARPWMRLADGNPHATGNGRIQGMSTQHRGRAAQSALMSGMRPAKKPRNKK